METFRIEFTAIIFIYITAITTSEVLEIFRTRPDDDGGWEKGTDSFTIPYSLCGQHDSNSMNCESFNAKGTSGSTDECHCSCSNENATLMYRTNKWKCIKNSETRELLGE